MRCRNKQEEKFVDNQSNNPEGDQSGPLRADWQARMDWLNGPMPPDTLRIQVTEEPSGICTAMFHLDRNGPTTAAQDIAMLLQLREMVKSAEENLIQRVLVSHGGTREELMDILATLQRKVREVSDTEQLEYGLTNPESPEPKDPQ